MIIFIHLICSIIQNFVRKLKEYKSFRDIFYLKPQNENINLMKRYKNVKHSLDLDPRVYYEQIYRAVESILLDNKWKGKMKKLVDFGCAEMEFFLYLKNIDYLEKILEIDVDEKLLRDHLFKVKPLISDYIAKRTLPLTVQVFTGSISDPSTELIGTDVVIAIEVIECLYPDALDALPYNIFNFIMPKMVIFTTPNADFEIHVPLGKECLHNNHKLEWTGKQFRSWAKNITVRFPDYSVNFYGIGNGSNGTQKLGCSQMAVFLNNSKMNLPEANNLHMEGYNFGNIGCTCEKCSPSKSFGVCTDCSCTNPFVKLFKFWWSIEEYSVTYKLIETIKFPFRDDRYHQQTLLDKLICNTSFKRGIGERFNHDKEIILNKFFFDKNFSFHKDRQILDDACYGIGQCTVSDELQVCAITEMESDISSPKTSSSTTTNDGKSSRNCSEWTTITESDESDCDTDTTMQMASSSWTDVTESSQSEAEGNVGTIMDGLISNVNNRINQRSSSSKNNNLSDSGYAKSNTIVTTSTPSSSNSSGLNDYCSSSNGEESKTKVAKIADKENNLTQILQNKDKLVPITKSTIAQFEVSTKICKNSSPPRDVAGTSLPSTSTGRKKKRTKRFDSDDSNSGASPPKLLEKEHYNFEYGVRSLLNREYDEIPKSHDMLIDNDAVGNGYFNTRFYDEEPIEETNTENVALLQSEAHLENNHEHMTEEPRDDDRELNVINAVELASREALFDPNSQVSLLDDYNISNVVYENLDLDGGNEVDQNVQLRGVYIIDSNAELALPISINPFPNWLLQMLLAEEGGEDIEAHDEPHFYCQGDGLGVHPSFANEDADDDDDTSSDSSPAVSTTDEDEAEAEAEPSESEVEVRSLPLDCTSETARQDRLRLEIVGTELERTSSPDTSSATTSATPSATTSAGTSTEVESADEYFDTVEVNDASNNNVKPSNKNCKE